MGDKPFTGMGLKEIEEEEWLPSGGRNLCLGEEEDKDRGGERKRN